MADKTKLREAEVLLQVPKKSVPDEVVRATFRTDKPPKRFIGELVTAEIQLKKGPKEIEGYLVDVLKN